MRELSKLEEFNVPEGNFSLIFPVDYPSPQCSLQLNRVTFFIVPFPHLCKFLPLRLLYLPCSYTQLKHLPNHLCCCLIETSISTHISMDSFNRQWCSVSNFMIICIYHCRSIVYTLVKAHSDNSASTFTWSGIGVRCYWKCQSFRWSITRDIRKQLE